MFTSVFRQLHNFADNYQGLASAARAKYSASPLARRRAFRQLSTLMLASIVASAVALSVHRANVSRERWGTTRVVLITSERVDSGSTLGPQNLTIANIPEGIVPTGTIDAGSNGNGVISKLKGQRTRVPLEQGQILSRSVLSGSATGKVAALLGPNQVAISVSLPRSRPPLEPDDIVDIYGASGIDSPVRRVARSARVVEIADQHITLILNTSEVDGVLSAEYAGGVAVVITG